MSRRCTHSSRLVLTQNWTFCCEGPFIAGGPRNARRVVAPRTLSPLSHGGSEHGARTTPPHLLLEAASSQLVAPPTQPPPPPRTIPPWSGGAWGGGGGRYSLASCELARAAGVCVLFQDDNHACTQSTSIPAAAQSCAGCLRPEMRQWRRRCRPGLPPAGQTGSKPGSPDERQACNPALLSQTVFLHSLPPLPPHPPIHPPTPVHSDFGRNDATFFARTHLGHLLHPGDTAMGYDVANANLVDPEVEKAIHKVRACVLSGVSPLLARPAGKVQLKKPSMR